MLRLVSDEDFHGDVIRGLLRREPALDLVRAVDVGLGRTPDPDVLEWAAAEKRVVLTRDVNTMVGHAWDRVRAGRPMPGVIAVTGGCGVGRAVDDILLVANCYPEEQIRDQVVFIPLR
jgi:hypothetical protein